MLEKIAKINKRDRVLYIVVAVLALTFGLSFVKSCTSTDSREVIKSALVNPKNGDLITGFELTSAGEKLSLTKTRNKDNDYWVLSVNDGEKTLPADSKRVTNFIKELTNIRNMYKLSDKNTIDAAFGLTDSSAFYVKYYYGDTFHTLTFGNQDFSLTGRYLMTDAKATVYEIDSSLDSYITLSVQNWSEALLISQEVLGAVKTADVQSIKVYSEEKSGRIEDVEKLLDLRHGGLPEVATAAVPEALVGHAAMEIILELGNRSSITLEIYPASSEGEYHVKAMYKNDDKENRPPLTYYSKISQWTYSKIKEITL